MAPREVFLGHDEETNRSDSIQYVPIFDTLKVLLSKDDVRKHVFTPDVRPGGIIKEFRDGTVFKTNPLFQSDDTVLQINLYFDDFVATNPLGNKTSKYKISAFYFVLGNLPRKKRSLLTSIHLLLLCPASFIKKYGYHTILAPLMNDLKKLEVNGFEVQINDQNVLMFGTVSMIIADNLAQHALGGYFESFSKVHRVCRYCMCLRTEMHKCLNDLSTQKRTVPTYQK